MMKSKSLKKTMLLAVGSVVCLIAGTVALAASGAEGIGSVAENVTGNLANIAKLITAASYVAGMGFGVAAIVKFKAHKDNPTQVTIGMPIALLFVAAALLFIPSVYQTSGTTLFGASGTVGGISGVTGFGASVAGSDVKQ
jgi:intracellular multiplication protein IcmD